MAIRWRSRAIAWIGSRPPASATPSGCRGSAITGVAPPPSCWSSWRCGSCNRPPYPSTTAPCAPISSGWRPWRPSCRCGGMSSTWSCIEAVPPVGRIRSATTAPWSACCARRSWPGPCSWPWGLRLTSRGRRSLVRWLLRASPRPRSVPRARRRLTGGRCCSSSFTTFCRAPRFQRCSSRLSPNGGRPVVAAAPSAIGICRRCWPEWSPLERPGMLAWPSLPPHRQPQSCQVRHFQTCNFQACHCQARQRWTCHCRTRRRRRRRRQPGCGQARRLLVGGPTFRRLTPCSSVSRLAAGRPALRPATSSGGWPSCRPCRPRFAPCGCLPAPGA